MGGFGQFGQRADIVRRADDHISPDRRGAVVVFGGEQTNGNVERNRGLQGHAGQLARADDSHQGTRALGRVRLFGTGHI